MPFKKGQSGNPGGRPRSHGDFREMARQFMGSTGVRTLLVMANLDGEDRRFALKILAEYAYGKPQQYVDLTSGGQALVKRITGDDAELLGLPSGD